MPINEWKMLGLRGWASFIRPSCGWSRFCSSSATQISLPNASESFSLSCPLENAPLIPSSGAFSHIFAHSFWNSFFGWMLAQPEPIHHHEDAHFFAYSLLWFWSSCFASKHNRHSNHEWWRDEQAAVLPPATIIYLYSSRARIQLAINRHILYQKESAQLISCFSLRCSERLRPGRRAVARNNC